MAALLKQSARLGLSGRHGQVFCRLPWALSFQRYMFNANKKILVEMDKSTGVALMKMANPPVNLLNLETLTEFAISMEKLELDKDCKGLILTSSLSKVFTAGLDIMEMCGKSPEHVTEFWRAVQEMWLKLYGSNLVTIAAINGFSPGAGCLMALACDYRIMADNVKYSIGLNETQLGIVAPFWLCASFYPTAHARQISKSMMRKPTIDRMLAQREADTKNTVGFLTKDSIQKLLQKYKEGLQAKKKA
nr:PREDICTED: enoyl-CoA delta isomerase 1, mitochondrial [Latimeria chalumnae]|eukprot:XP_006001521.1 PREDICTED: enoyl-CoA delta isomerase 1, mitochondrial [Latimeria chalumnae]